jgi:hypothetical protein
VAGFCEQLVSELGASLFRRIRNQLSFRNSEAVAQELLSVADNGPTQAHVLRTVEGLIADAALRIVTPAES